MVRSFQVDTALLDALPDLANVGHSTAQVGLVIGRLGVGQRDFAYLLLKTPDAQGTPVASVHTSAPSKGSGGKKAVKSGQVDVQVKIAVEAVEEHCLQVSALLPGDATKPWHWKIPGRGIDRYAGLGLDIMGLYIACPEGGFAGSIPQLCTIAERFWASKGEKRRDMLLLHVDPATRRLSGREYPSDSKQAVKPCELKQQELLSSLEILQCSFPVDISIYAPAGVSLGDSLSAAVSRETSAVRSAIAQVGGKLLAEGTTVGDLPLAAPGTTHDVELLCPPSCTGNDRVDTQGETSGRLHIQGMVHGRAFAYKRESAAAAIGLLKEDIARSLLARADVLMLDADEDNRPGGLLETPSGQALRIELPRRAFFTVKGGLQFSDYVLAGEYEEQVQETASGALALDLDAASISWPESVAVKANVVQLKPKDSTGISDGLGEGRPAIPFGLKTGKQVVTISTLICVISCLVSYVILSGVLTR